jgi:hypothetical protein
MVRSMQTMQLSCDKISTISKRTKTSYHLSLVNLEYHQVRPISNPMLRLVQTVHLSSCNTDTIAERTETGLHMSHIT